MQTMATAPSHFTAFAEARRQVWINRLLGFLVLASAVAALWFAATYHTTVFKKEAPVSMLMPVEAPPPPPPPKEQQSQETAQAIEQPIAPQQTQTPKDNAITQNAEAQIGGDAYGIGSGSGEGMRGGGVAGMLSRGPYANYMAQAIRQAVNRNATLRDKTFKVSVGLWLTPAGKITKAVLRSSTGSDEIDRELQGLLAAMPPFAEAPPQSILDTQPVNMTIDIRKSL